MATGRAVLRRGRLCGDVVTMGMAVGGWFQLSVPVAGEVGRPSAASPQTEKPRRLPRLFGVEVQFGCAMRLGDLALQAEGREAEGEKGDRGGLRNGSPATREVGGGTERLRLVGSLHNHALRTGGNVTTGTRGAVISDCEDRIGRVFRDIDSRLVIRNTSSTAGGNRRGT